MHLLEQSLHLREHFGVFRVVGQVVQLLGIIVVIVELLAVFPEGPLGVPPALGPDAVAGIDAALDLGVSGVVPLGLGIVDQRPKLSLV
jgi:hypothetical protein